MKFFREPKGETIVPFYHKTYIFGLQAFLRDKFNVWAGNGSYVEVIWKNFKDIILDGIKCYVPQTILNKSPYPEYYNKEIKYLNVKVMKMYYSVANAIIRKFNQQNQVNPSPLVLTL